MSALPACRRLPDEAGDFQTSRVGSIEVGASCFDPSDVPFLLPAKMPVIFPMFASDGGLVACGDGQTIGEEKNHVRHEDGTDSYRKQGEFNEYERLCG